MISVIKKSITFFYTESLLALCMVVDPPRPRPLISPRLHLSVRFSFNTPAKNANGAARTDTASSVFEHTTSDLVRSFRRQSRIDRYDLHLRRFEDSECMKERPMLQCHSRNDLLS